MSELIILVESVNFRAFWSKMTKIDPKISKNRTYCFYLFLYISYAVVLSYVSISMIV